MTEPEHPSRSVPLLGHDASLRLFRDARAEGRLAHAWLLTGPPGIGKATLAWHMARELMAPAAEARIVHTPAHPVFRMLAAPAHPDLQVLERQVSKTTGKLSAEIVIDQVRLAIQRLRETPVLGGHRVLLIDPADLLNVNAANALLKLLEEPPAGVVLLLVCQRPGRLPRTVASRCLTLHLRPLPPAQLAEVLGRAPPDPAPATLTALLDLARGSPGRAQQIARSGWLELYQQCAQAVPRADLATRVRLAERLAARSRTHGPGAAAAPLLELLRRAVLLAAGAGPALAALPEEPAALDALARRLGLDRLLGLWDTLRAGVDDLERLNLDPLQTFTVLLGPLGGEAAG